MAKKGNRIQVILEVLNINQVVYLEHQEIHYHENKNTPDRMEIKKLIQF